MMQVNAVISAPGELNRNLSKANLRRSDVSILGVIWETADFICVDGRCGHVKDGYGNYVKSLEVELVKLRSFVAKLSIDQSGKYDSGEVGS